MFSETQYYESYIFSPLYILLVVYELVKGVFDGWGGHMEEHMESGYEKDTRSERHVTQLLLIPKMLRKNYIQILFIFLQFILYNVCIKRNLYS